MDGGTSDRLRALPSVDRVITELSGVPQSVAAGVARHAIDTARASIRAGEPAPSFEEIVDSARAILADAARHRLQPVINATGVLLHTNLGRAPLGHEQLEAVRHIAGGYSNLEYDLVAGKRGDRYSHSSATLTALTGAEAALVVNNNAAAVLLVLASLCASREVVISRGELIEIGGEFRIPDVLSASGARLVEVGTTNRTHAIDYQRAIGPETAAILKVHPSNYKITGFTASVEAREVAAIAQDHNVLFIHDLGSGLIETTDPQQWVADEPPISVAIEDGADIVTFSGDKLLGGPQAGVIVGRAELIQRIARHPLLRALRVDKMTLAALQATLDAYGSGDVARVPLWNMASADDADLEIRARAICDALAAGLPPAVKVEAIPVAGVAGGGSSPGIEIGSWAVAIVHPEVSVDEIERSLRFGTPPVIARVEDDRLLVDLRTVHPDSDDTLRQALGSALAP